MLSFLFVLFHFTKRSDWTTDCVFHQPFTLPIWQNVGEMMAPKQNDHAVYDLVLVGARVEQQHLDERK